MLFVHYEASSKESLFTYQFLKEDRKNDLTSPISFGRFWINAIGTMKRVPWAIKALCSSPPPIISSLLNYTEMQTHSHTFSKNILRLFILLQLRTDIFNQLTAPKRLKKPLERGQTMLINITLLRIFPQIPTNWHHYFKSWLLTQPVERVVQSPAI